MHKEHLKKATLNILGFSWLMKKHLCVVVDLESQAARLHLAYQVAFLLRTFAVRSIKIGNSDEHDIGFHT